MARRLIDWMERRRCGRLLNRIERKYGVQIRRRFSVELNHEELELLEAQHVNGEDHRLLAIDRISEFGALAYDDAVMKAKRRHAQGDAMGSAHWKAIAASIAKENARATTDA